MFYDSIDNLPMYNFDKINATGSLAYLRTHPLAFLYRKRLPKVWETIYDEYLSFFGLNEKYKEYLLFKTEALRLYNEAYNGGSKYLVTLAAIKDKQAEEVLQGLNGGDLQDTAAAVSKRMGFRVDLKKVTVKEFFSYLKMAQNG